MLYNAQTLPYDVLYDSSVLDVEFDQQDESSRGTWLDCVSDRRISRGEITLISF
jgi:hypothetical protein